MVDLTDCADEPIRVPGAVQPHGILLVLDSGSERILSSAGDPQALLKFHGDPAGRLFRELAGVPLMELTEGAGLTPGQEPLFLGSIQPDNGLELDILAHERAGMVLVELEPSLQDRPSAARLLARVRAGVAAIKKSAGLASACETAADAVRSLTRHDRVMIYQFMPDGAGRVVAESRSEALGSFLNQHFPASDIPQQARELYLLNLIRAIPDVFYEPASLTGGMEPHELDMSDCALRSVSPIHIQYLKNMGVSSSMSVSIVVNDALWGLVACHGAAANLVPYEMREACKHIATSLSQRIETIEVSERAAEADRLTVGHDKLLGFLARSDSIGGELKRRLAELQQLIPSTGIIVCSEGMVAAHGAVPAIEQCQELCSFTRRHDDTPPYSTDNISAALGTSAPYLHLVSGVLSLTAGAERPIQISWVRPEYKQTIEWAGRPHKGEGTEGVVDPLTPRASFAAWTEIVRGRSEAWSPAEVEAAQRLRDGIERIQVRQRLISLQAEVIHMSRVNAMGTMASAIAHELNQPLTIVHNYAGGLSRMLGQREAGDPEISDVLQRISEQSLRAGEIVRHLRQLVAGTPMTLTRQNLRSLVESACSIGLLDAARLGISPIVRMPEDLWVLADPVQIQQVLINLLRNSIEAIASAESSGPPTLTIGAARVEEDFVEITVSDTGPGVPESVRKRLFSAFNSSKESGLGIGLSICRTIVEAHGGKIGAGFPSEAGAVFRFTLQEAPEHG